MSDPNAPKPWLYRPSTVNGIYWGLVAVCGMLLVLDLFTEKEHLHFGWEHWWGLYGLIGFFASVVIVFSAVGLRRIVMRSEDYYDE